jgi:hypothetical protein
MSLKNLFTVFNNKMEDHGDGGYCVEKSLKGIDCRKPAKKNLL